MLLLASGCVKTIALHSMADALSGSGKVYARDDDPQLVRAAIPVMIKTMEEVLDGVPDHVGLLTALTQAVTSYGAAFVEDDADRLADRDMEAAQLVYKRARRLFWRARGYGLRGLDLELPNFSKTFAGNSRKAQTELLARAKKEDVPLLYWTGAAWASAISVAKDDLELVGELPEVEAMMRRALALDESFDEGALHEFFIALDGGRSESEGGGAKKAWAHLQRALELSHGKKMSPLVTYAETVDVQTQNQKQFRELLGRVLAFDVDTDVDHRLVNMLAQRRARWLLSRTGDLFVD